MIVLKLEAFADRKDSTKGDKDAKDLMRIAEIANTNNEKLRTGLITPFLRDDHIELLDRVSKGSYALSLANGNSMKAKQYRKSFTLIANDIKEAYKNLNIFANNKDKDSVNLPVNKPTNNSKIKKSNYEI